MRIVFLSYNYSPDIHSPQEWLDRIKFYVGWSELLANQHTIIRVDQVNYKGKFTHLNIQYHFVDDGKKEKYFPHKLHRFVKELSPDVVVVSSFLYPLQLIQLRGCLGNKVKIVVQNHAERPSSGIKKILQRYASTKVNAFLFTSYEIGLSWVNNGNIQSKNKIFELMEVSSAFHVIDKRSAREKTSVTSEPVFLWVGRLNNNKDPLLAVKAFLDFVILFPAAKLYMIYHTDELEKEVKILLQQSHKNNIILIGKVPHEELLYWFNSADFFISASHYEGSGTALCEAMSCGCIPIVTNIPSFSKINGNIGLLYEPGKSNALLEALKVVVLMNKEEKKQEVLHHFNNSLSFTAIARQFQDIIGSL